MKNKIKDKIKALETQYENLGQHRKSCANLGRGVTDSILNDMNNVQSQISTLKELLKEEK